MGWLQKLAIISRKHRKKSRRRHRKKSEDIKLQLKHGNSDLKDTEMLGRVVRCMRPSLRQRLTVLWRAGAALIPVSWSSWRWALHCVMNSRPHPWFPWKVGENHGIQEVKVREFCLCLGKIACIVIFWLCNWCCNIFFSGQKRNELLLIIWIEFLPCN